jgi:CitMHS family citrate-Mg2+:H+ or citrate-Ca2+:H+ symporter
MSRPPSPAWPCRIPEARRPYHGFNAALTIALIAGLVSGILPLSVLMMLAFAVAMIVNYPQVAEQKERIAAHAGNVLSVVSLIFAAGIFTGILSGTGMVEAMSKEVVGWIRRCWGRIWPITAALSLPFTFFISNDAFYRHAADPGRGGYALWRVADGDRPRLADGPAGPSAQPAGAVDLSAGQPGGRRPGRSPRCSPLVPAATVCMVMTLVGMAVLAFLLMG